MFGFLTRKLTFFVLMTLAVCVPYLVYNGDINKIGDTVSSFIPSAKSSDSKSTLGASTSGSVDPVTNPTTPPGATLAGPEFKGLQTALRFSITPDWVMSHWSRVSVLEVDGMRGMRVPLITGVQMQDVAGSLTYCFDENDQLQRLTFRGSTGDPREIVRVASGAFKPKAEPQVKPGLHVARWNSTPTSFLLVESASIVRADSPHSRYAVSMEINRPRAYMKTSPEMQQFVTSLRKRDDGVWRW